MNEPPRSLGPAATTLIAMAAAILAIGGCEDAVDGTFECGGDTCLEASEYCEWLQPDISKEPISETCVSIPYECNSLAAGACSPDDDPFEKALGQCIHESVEDVRGYTRLCLSGRWALYIRLFGRED